jgi:hypothetical protein
MTTYQQSILKLIHGWRVVEWSSKESCRGGAVEKGERRKQQSSCRLLSCRESCRAVDLQSCRERSCTRAAAAQREL